MVNNIIPFIILGIAALIVIWLLWDNCRPRETTVIIPETAEGFMQLEPSESQYLTWYLNQYPNLQPYWWPTVYPQIRNSRGHRRRYRNSLYSDASSSSSPRHRSSQRYR